jgi:archaeal flagellin FlaB
MGNKIRRIFKENKGSIGIGAMIVFIAMVLVAGIAASVLIQTSTTLESQALATGRETTVEVSTGLSVVGISGANTSGLITDLAIIVRTRAGSEEIDLAQTVIEISNSTVKNFLTYDDATITLADDVNGSIFNSTYYPTDATHFTVIVLEDADGSCSAADSAVINSGDYVILGVDTTSCFGGLLPRQDIWGLVIPEDGSPGVIHFRCPNSFTDDVMELQ